MDIEEDLLLAMILIRRKRRRQKKKAYWIHPLLLERASKGLFNTLYEDLLLHGDKFFKYFRMSRNSFNELLGGIIDDIKKMDTPMRESIPANERLALTLRYLASGCTMNHLHIDYRIGLSTISYIIRQVCDAIWRSWRDKCFPVLTKDILLKVAEGFEQRANFPHCIGAIDGKHIHVIKPIGSGSLNFNYKHHFSIILLAVCDSDYKFLYIDVGSPGKASDSAIFKNSRLYRMLVSNNIERPLPKSLSHNRPENVPYFLIGDEGFGLSSYLLRPYGGNFLSVEKKVFNYRLTRARRYIECSFGILSNKWRILHRALNVGEDLADNIIKTCCLLHNFVRERDGFKFEETLVIDGLNNGLPVDNTQPGNQTKCMRTLFAEYFMNEGALPWQLDKI